VEMTERNSPDLLREPASSILETEPPHGWRSEGSR
jgi:hypothetical protein